MLRAENPDISVSIGFVSISKKPPTVFRDKKPDIFVNTKLPKIKKGPTLVRVENPDIFVSKILISIEKTPPTVFKAENPDIIVNELLLKITKFP